MGFLRKYLFPALRSIIFPILFGVIFFNLFKHRLPKYKVLSPLETIDLLKKDDKLSLVRFGDGELEIITNKGAPNYQKASPHLRKTLVKILNSRNICVGSVSGCVDARKLHPSPVAILENLRRLKIRIVPSHS